MNSRSMRSPNSNQIELIQQFSTVTGSGRDAAQRMLQCYNWNLQLAIIRYIDEQSEPVDVSGHAVRVGQTLWPRKRPRPVNDTPHCTDEADNQDASSSDTEENPIYKRRRRNLDELYGPPLELIPKGTFESAREYGQKTNRWLMVNIQNSSEFSCHVMNSDVWSNPIVKELIKEHFVLWQDDVDSPGGSRYMRFYNPVVEFPYLAVIDPRTGDKLVEWHGMDSANELYGLVDVFLEVFGSLSASVFQSDLGLLDQIEVDNLMKASSSKSSRLDDSEDGRLMKATSSNSGLDQSKDGDCLAAENGLTLTFLYNENYINLETLKSEISAGDLCKINVRNLNERSPDAINEGCTESSKGEDIKMEETGKTN